MPKQLTRILSWHNKTRRWRKRFRGKEFNHGGDYQTALEAYETWRKGFATAENVVAAEDFFELARTLTHDNLLTADPVRVQKLANGLGLKLDFVRLKRQAKDKVQRLFEELGGKEIPDEETLGFHIQKFIDRKQAQAAAGERSWGRAGNIVNHLGQHFQNFVGEKTHPSNINGRTLVDFHSHLLNQIGQKKISRHHAKSIFNTTKQFIRRLWESDLCELPKNINSPELQIGVGKKKIQTYTAQEVKSLLDDAPEMVQLFVLLALNCGFTQKDIADLRPDEVDWKAGRIIRERSKTRNKHNDEADENRAVNYKLWGETFRLLKKLRSKNSATVLINENGVPLLRWWMEEKQVKKVDNIRTAFQRRAKKIGMTGKQFKWLRKTSATFLKSDPRFRGLVSYFLGHSPRSMADMHYAAESEVLVDSALDWLGQQFGF